MLGIRDTIYKYTQDDKVFELAALLKDIFPRRMIIYSAMYVPTPNIPCEHHFGVPLTLRLFVATKIASVATKIASLINEGIELSTTLNFKEEENLNKTLKVMNDVMKLLELAERGDLEDFHEEQPLIDGDCYGISKGSQGQLRFLSFVPQ